MPRRSLLRRVWRRRGFPLPRRDVGKTKSRTSGKKTRAENLANYLLKGKQVYVEGRLQTRSYDDKDGKKVYATEVIAEEVVLLGGQAEGQSGAPQAARAAAAGGVGKSKASGAGDDDLSDMHITDNDVPF